MFQAFCRLHGIGKLKGLRAQFSASNDLVSTADFLNDSGSGSTELFIKTLRIKAFKAYEWLGAPDSPFKVLITILAEGPLEHIMFKFLEWQGEDEFAMADCPPLVQMVTDSDKSPIYKAVARLQQLLTTRAIFPREITLLKLAQGKC